MNPSLARSSAPDPRHRPDAIAERILPAELRRGRGAATNASGRFESERREAFERWLAPDNFDAAGRQKISLTSLNREAAA